MDVCERWVPNPGHPGGGRRRDFLGLVDLIAVRGSVTMGVQTTTNSNVNNHLTKMLDDEHRSNLADLIAAGWLICVHGWRLSTRDFHACTHGRARCGCRWVLHRNIVLDIRMLV